MPRPTKTPGIRMFNTLPLPRSPNYGCRERNEAKHRHEHTSGMAQEPIYGLFLKEYLGCR